MAGKLLYSKNEVELHCEIMKSIYDTSKTIPLFYQAAIINALNKASPGMVMHFYAYLDEIASDVLKEFFSEDIPVVFTPYSKGCKGNRLEELKELL